MGYKKAADGPVVSKGKTNVQVFPNDGPKKIDNGPKATKSKLNASYKAVGRNVARANNQRGR
jgi:hypothetical protein